MPLTRPHLSAPTQVPFEQLMLDPNNPRISPEPAPGYADADALFDDQDQTVLADRVFEAYQAEGLEETITRLGWTPVDPIMVWRHPDRSDVCVVVEGNTRTAILRRARTRLTAARVKLDKMTTGGKFTKDLVDQQRAMVAKLQALVDATQDLEVSFVEAENAKVLTEKLPLLLGVRHVQHSKNWGPYATNLYITSLYHELFREKFGPERRLSLDRELLAQVAEIFSMRELDARRSIQAASAFSHFKLTYEDRLPEGSAFENKDQYYFEQVLQSKYARDQFGFGNEELELSEEASEAMYEWAFAKGKSKSKNEDDDDSSHVFGKAEDIRAWQSLSRYDVKNATSFASQLDVSNPKDATSIRDLTFQKDQHKARHTPLQSLTALLGGLKQLKGHDLIAQAGMLEPVLQEIGTTTTAFLSMIASAHKAETA